MFESIMNFFKKLGKTENKETKSKETAKERLHLVLMQDRANVSADFLEMMKQEIIEVIKKYIEVDEKEIDVRLTNEVKEDGTTGAPSLYANIPIVNIKNEMKKEVTEQSKEETNNKEKDDNKKENKNEEKVVEKTEENPKDEEAKLNEEAVKVEQEEKTEEENNDNKEEMVEEKPEQKEETKKENKDDNKSGE